MLYIWYNDGNSTQWVVADNIAGAYLPLGGGTLTGALTLAADAAQPLQPVTLEQMQAYAPVNVAGGFLNRLRNGTFDVWQRGTSVTIGAGAVGYTADGWIVQTAGAACNVGAGGGNFTVNQAVLNGAAGLTQLNLYQYIESYVAAPLRTKTCTFQAKIFNNTGGPLTPQLATYYPNATDNFSAVTQDLANVGLQTIASGATAVVSYTFNVSTNAIRGYAVYLVFSGQLNGAGKWVGVGECDLRATPGLPVGLQANPPPPELRPAGTETAFCQRYFNTFGGILLGLTTSNVTWSSQPTIIISPVMRANPTMSFASFTASSGNAGTPAVSYVSYNYVAISNSAFNWTQGAGIAVINFTGNFSAEL
jgi:hypothetical protein